jgi:hypothetical protein
VAITSALELAGPTSRGIEDCQRTSVRSAAGATSRAKRSTVAWTNGLAGLIVSPSAARAQASADQVWSATARTALP